MARRWTLSVPVREVDGRLRDPDRASADVPDGNGTGEPRCRGARVDSAGRPLLTRMGSRRFELPQIPHPRTAIGAGLEGDPLQKFIPT
jgi:hypothetical protein